MSTTAVSSPRGTPGPAQSGTTLASRFEAWLDKLDDRVNPIVVKELRQAVQGRFLSSMLLFFLLLQVLVVGMFLLAGAGQNGQASGQESFLTLQGILLFIAFFFLPISVVVRLFRERTDQNLDLMFITTLSPASIIRGKFFAGLVLALLLFSACMPFLVLTYFLRGIDILSILIIVVSSFAGVALALLAAIFVGCLVRHPVLRVLVGIVGLIDLFTAYTFLQAGLGVLLASGLGSRADDWSVLGWATAWSLIVALAGSALFVLSVALITPVTANRARPVRRYFTFAWGLSLALAVSMVLLLGEEEILMVWQACAAVFVALALVVAVCAPDLPSRRVLSSLPDPDQQRSAWRRRFEFVLASGAAGGLVWGVLLGGATIAAGTLASVLQLGGAGAVQELAEATARTAGFLAYSLAYVLLALALQRRFLLRRISRKQTWLIVLVLVSASMVLPLIVALLINPGGNIEWALLLSPFGIFAESLLLEALVIAGVGALLMVLLHVSWLLQQFKAFRPPKSALAPGPVSLPDDAGDG